MAGFVRTELANRLASLAEVLVEPVLEAVGDRAVVLTPSGVLAGVPWTLLPGFVGRPVTVAQSATSWLGRRTTPLRLATAGFVAGPRVARAEDEVVAAAKEWPDATVLVGDRANAAARTTDARYSASTVANRIKKIGADIRRLQRAIDEPHYDPQRGYVHATDEQKAARGTRLDPRIAELRDQLAYWTRVRDEQVATGAATNYTREQIHPGDAVKVHGHWRRVVRANPTTVSVESGFGWTDKATYAAIDDHRTAAQVATAAATQ